ncbi:MAG: serine--tRNA ligase, partial [Candidatus Nanopelagicales bacterium]
LDPKILRDSPELVVASQRARGANEALVTAWQEADSNWRNLNTKYDALRAEQKNLSKSIGPLQGKLKSGDNSVQAELDNLMKQAADMATELTQIAADRDAAEAKTNELMASFANIVDERAPVGGEEDFKVIQTIGKPRDFNAEGFAPKDHIELGEMLGAIDIERGAKVSGSRFYYLTGVGALLELALVRMAMEFATKAGFTAVIPPSLVRPQAMEGTGFLGQAAVDVYHLPADDLYLVGTSEVPLAAFHMDEILDGRDLPLRYAGFSPCFRREAGSHGKDTKGIIRVHWFDKVELFAFCDPKDAAAEHEKFLAFEKEFLTALELPFRVLDIATGDLGMSAIRKFDCEAWIPSQDTYREVTSTSNCTTFQSRRLRIRSKVSESAEYVATLNGTLMASTRTIVAILENHQQADGSVKIPAALVPHLGIDVLKPVAKRA